MKKTLQKGFQIAVNLALGAGIALCILPWALANFADDPLWLFEAKIFLGFIPAYVCYLLMIVAHEAGHLLAGLKSGYEFVSFRVLSVMLIRLNGKLQWKRYSLAGTGGQCLMKPPAWTEHGIPVQLYNWGGVMVNAVLLVMTVPLLFIVPLDTIGGILLSMMAVLNAWGVVANGIPMMNNDADNALHLTKNMTAQHAFWAMMMGHALLTEGTALRDIPEELYALPEGADLHNALIASSAANQAQIHMYHHRFDEADQAMADVLERAGDGLHPVNRFTMLNERVWYELMHERRADVVAAFEDKQFKQYRKAMKDYPSVIRVQYTEALAAGDRDAAEKLKAQMTKVAQTYPYQQEIEEELALMQLADDRFADTGKAV